MSALGGWFLRFTHQLNLDQEAPLLSMCLMFSWRCPFSTLAADEVSCSINYSIIVFPPVFLGIKLMVELEWFSTSEKDFKMGNWNWWILSGSLSGLEYIANHNDPRHFPLCEISDIHCI
jgi:hypothetical protein